MHAFHSYNVQTVYIHEYTGICLYVCVYTCLDHVACTISLFHEQEIQKEKILHTAGYKPTIVCITASCLNHYATRMLVSDTTVTVHVYCFT